MPCVPISQFPLHLFLGNRLLKACLLVSIPSAVFLAGCFFFSTFLTHILYDRDPVPTAHTPPVSPTSAPSNSLTACLAHLPCLRPPFPSCLSGQAPVSSIGLSVQGAALPPSWLWQPDPRSSWAPRQLSTHHPLSGMQSSYFSKQVPEGQPGSYWAGTSRLKGLKQTQTRPTQSVLPDGTGE